MKPLKCILVKSILWGALFVLGQQGMAVEPVMDSVRAKHSAPAETVKVKKHSPRTATIMSAVLPGLGQFYNRKYWKIPLIYGGGAAFIYFINDYNDRYYGFRTSLKQYNNNEDITNSRIANTVLRWEEQGVNSADISDILKQGRDYYRKYRDLNVIFLSGFYVLNIIDAMVDAHFFVFDVSNDLTMNIRPANVQGYHANAFGLSLCFNF